MRRENRLVENSYMSEELVALRAVVAASSSRRRSEARIAMPVDSCAALVVLRSDPVTHQRRRFLGTQNVCSAFFQIPISRQMAVPVRMMSPLDVPELLA